MALTFPINLITFFSTLPLAEMTFELTESMVISRLGNGEIISSDYSTRLWQGQCNVATDLYHRDGEKLAAMGRAIRESRASFLVTPIHAPKPAAMVTVPAAPKIHSVQNGRQIRLKGLVPSSKMTAGDFVSWSYGSSPVRTSLHQLVEGDTADGSGITGWMEVTPMLTAGAVAETPVVLDKPYCVAKYIPGSWGSPQVKSLYAGGFSFQWVQTFR